MLRNVIIVVLVSVIFQCNGHLPSLTGILGGAHKHVHHTVQGVANTVLGGFNFEGHVQAGGHSRPQPPRTEQPETVIVIVDESPDNDYSPGPQNRPNQGHGQYNHNNGPYRPHGHNNYGHGRPWQNQNGNYNNVNSNRPYHNHYGQHPYNNGNHNGYGHNHNGNQYQHVNQNNFNRPEQTTQGYGNPNNGYNNQPSDQSTQNNGYTSQNNYGQTQSPPTAETRPTFGSIHENDSHTNKPNQNDKTTTESDVPQFVPLNPNEYVYGGEKINIAAPKRETDSNKPASDNDDDEYAIDIRGFKTTNK